MASKTDEQITELEAELQKTPYNKKTQHHIGKLKAKISMLKDKKESSSKGGGGEGFSVKKTGDATVVLVGFPSVGKSTLLNQLTNAESKTGSYAFTTLDVIPGMMNYDGARIQLLDVPGLIGGAATGSGRGREIISVVRNADLLVLLLDQKGISQYKTITKELNEAGFRLNAEKPYVKIMKKERGGLKVDFAIKKHKLDAETAKLVLKEYKIINGEVVIRQDISIDELVDAVSGNRKYIPAITVVNKIDEMNRTTAQKLKKEFKDAIFISAENGTGLEELRRKIFPSLGLIRVYMKQVGKKADMEEPLVVLKDSSVKDVCSKIHRDFVNRFRFARVWGKSAKFPGQKFQLDHIVKDKDVVQLHLS